MFDNIGSKIKSMAKAFTAIGIIASVFFGIVLMKNRYTQANGIAVLIIGPLCSWLGSLTLYGFGELIELASSINSRLNDLKAAGETNEAQVHQRIGSYYNEEREARRVRSSRRNNSPDESVQPMEEPAPEQTEKTQAEECARYRDALLRANGGDPRIKYWVNNLDQWLREGTITPEEYIQKLNQLVQ